MEEQKHELELKLHDLEKAKIVERWLAVTMWLLLIAVILMIAALVGV